MAFLLSLDTSLGHDNPVCQHLNSKMNSSLIQCLTKRGLALNNAGEGSFELQWNEKRYSNH